MRRFNKQSNYQRQLKGGRSAKPQGGGRSGYQAGFGASSTSDLTARNDALCDKLGFARYTEGGPRLGWVLNFAQTSLPGPDGATLSALDVIFLCQDGTQFRAAVPHRPYFFVAAAASQAGRYSRELIALLKRKFDTVGLEIDQVRSLSWAPRPSPLTPLPPLRWKRRTSTCPTTWPGTGGATSS